MGGSKKSQWNDLQLKQFQKLSLKKFFPSFFFFETPGIEPMAEGHGMLYQWIALQPLKYNLIVQNNHSMGQRQTAEKKNTSCEF